MQAILDFIDKVSNHESKRRESVLLSLSEARALRDELAKLLAQRAYENRTSEPIKIELNGGRW